MKPTRDLRERIDNRPATTAFRAQNSQDRELRLALTVKKGLVARVAVLLVGIASVPLAVPVLGRADYGLWLTITSLSSLVGLADLGIGNGLINALGTHDDAKRSRALISGAVGITVIGGLVLSLAALALGLSGYAGRLIGSHRVSANHAVSVAVLAYAVALPLSITEKVRTAYQRGDKNSLWVIANQLATLGILLVMLQVRPTLALFVGAVLAAPTLVQAVSTVYLFRKEYPGLRPSLRLAQHSPILPLLKTGLLFFFLQVASLVAFASDYLIVGQVLGSGAVAQYGVAAKATTAFTSLVLVPVAGLWPAYVNALAAKEFGWVQASHRRWTLRMLGLGVAFLGGMSVLGPVVLSSWTGNEIPIGTALCIAFGGWAIALCLGNVVAALLNALGAIRYQVVTITLMVATNLPLSIWLTRTLGPQGAILGSLISYVVTVLAPSYFYLHRVLRAQDLEIAKGSGT